MLYGHVQCSDYIHCRERINGPSEANLSDFVSYVCVSTCLPTLLIVDDGCLIALYSSCCLLFVIFTIYLETLYMASVTDGSVHTVNTYTCTYVHSCVYC